MAHAEKCPVCDGKGQVKTFNPLDYASTSGVTTSLGVCPACLGKCYLVIEDASPINCPCCPCPRSMGYPRIGIDIAAPSEFMPFTEQHEKIILKAMGKEDEVINVG